MESSANKQTILIADHAKASRSDLMACFSGEYHVLQADSGPCALDILHTNKNIILAILDLNLPGMDAFAVMNVLQQDERLKYLPVIMITPTSDEQTQIQVLDSGAVDIITKPFHPVIVAHRVQSIINRIHSEKLAQRNRIYEQQIKFMETDEKTGLYNRAAFCRHARELLNANPDEKYVILRWDIDHFKVFNDLYGIKAGDELLHRVGAFYQRLERSISPNSGIFAHWESDHFVTLRQKGSFQTNHILDIIGSEMAKDYPNFDFVARIGIYEISDPNVDITLMCDRALMALRSIKNNFEKRVAYYDENMRKVLLEEQELAAEMRQALNEGQFILYFQPQYNYDKKRLIGAEALVRWNHPIKGVISPAHFIPTFERNGFISELDEYVWKKACACLKKWQDEGIELVPLSVNVSRKDISNPHLCQIFQDLITEYDLSPHYLRLEITESAYMDNPDQLIKVISSLQNAGFQVEMDDFGSGYSSLNMLKDIPVDILKMDMKFLSKRNADIRGGSILSSVVRMAHAINLPVIAEGVENAWQADYLKSVGCLYMQGYFFARPMSQTLFEAVLKNTKVLLQDKRFTTTGVENAADFMDANVQSTLLFNSFVGGAAIIEFDGQNVEALRINDDYFRILGTNREEYREFQSHMLSQFTKKDRKVFLSMLHKAIKQSTENTCQILCKPFAKDKERVWARIRVRFLSEHTGIFLFYMAVDNITESMNLLEKNTELSDRLSNIIKNLPTGVAIVELGKEFIPQYVSEKTCQIFGYTKEELNDGETLPKISNLVSILTSYMPQTMEKLESGKTVDIPQLKAHRKDGTAFWLHAICSLVQRERHPALCYVSLQDITEQVDTEEALNSQQQEMAALVQAVPGGIFKYHASADDSFTYISDNMLRMLGYTMEEFTEKFHNRFSEMVYWEDRERVLREIDEQIESDSFDVCEYRIETKSGQLKWVYDLGHLIRDKGKDYFVVVIVDMDARKRLEQELKAERMRTDALIRNLPGGVAKLYRSDSGTTALTFVNDGLCRMTGFDRDELMHLTNNSCYAMVALPDRNKISILIERALQTGETISTQCRLIRKDNTALWVNIKTSVTTDNEGSTGYLNLTDIAETKKMETELKASQQRLNGVINSIPGGVAVYEIFSDYFRPVYLSDRLSELSGRTPEEYQHLLEVEKGTSIFPQDEKMVIDTVHKAVKDGSTVDLNYRIMHKDGHLLWVNLRGKVVGKRNAHPIFYAIFQRLSSATELYIRILNQSDRIIMVGDVNTHELFFVNEKAAQMAGKTREEADGCTCYEYLLNREKPCEFCHLSEISKHEISVTRQIGQKRYDIRLKPVKWNDRDAFINYSTDITEEYNAKQLLRKDKNRLTQIINYIPAGIGVFKQTADGHLMVSAINESAEKLTCFKDRSAVLSPEDFTAYVHPDERELVQNELQALYDGKERVSMSYRQCCGEGTPYRWIYTICTAVTAPDGIRTVYVSYTDITQLQQAKLTSTRQTAFLQKLYDYLPCSVIHWRNENEIAYINPYGIRVHEATQNADGKWDYTPVLQAEKEKLIEARNRLQKTGTPQAFEYSGITPSGSVKHFSGILFNGMEQTYVTISIDMTDKQESESRLLQILQNIPGGAAMFRVRDKKITRPYLSDHAAAILGYTAKTAPTDFNEAMEHVSPVDREKLRKLLPKAVREGKEINWDFRIHKEGEKQHWINLLTSKGIVQGEETIYYGIYSDITVRKEYEEKQNADRKRRIRQLQEETARLESLQQDSLLLKLTINLTKDKIEDRQNGTALFRTIVGMRMEEACQQLLQQAMPQEKDQKRAQVQFDRKRILKNFALGAQEESEVYHCYDKHGKLCWVKAVVKCYEDPQTCDIKCLIYFFDIDAKKTADDIINRIADREYELLALVDTVSGSLRCYHCTDPKETEILSTITTWQERIESFIENHLLQEDREEAKKTFSVAHLIKELDQKKEYDCSFAVQHGNTFCRKRWEFSYMGQTKRTILLMRSDITVLFQKQAQQEEMLRDALRRAEEASKAKSDFLARMSHEMRTPMNAIIGLTALAKEQIQDPAYVKDSLEKISASGGLLHQQINDILEMTQMNREDISLHPQIYQLTDLRQQMDALIRPLCKQKNIQFKIVEKQTPDVELYIDKDRINQLFFNLLSNAVKNTPPGGKVEFGIFQREKKNEKLHICCTVSDTGIGISEEFQKKMYEPFTRQITELSRDTLGTGLGLSLVKMIVKRMGGTIECDSTLGKGTCFTVNLSLPIHTTSGEWKEQAPAFTKEPSSLPVLTEKRVLLVDDNRVNLEVAKALLERKGMLVDSAMNGKEALDRFLSKGQGYYDLVLTDIFMPQMDGLELACAIRQSDRDDAKTIPMIALSANAFAQDQKRSLDAGINVHLAKPIRPNELYDTIASLLG